MGKKWGDLCSLRFSLLKRAHKTSEKKNHSHSEEGGDIVMEMHQLETNMKTTGNFPLNFVFKNSPVPERIESVQG